MEGHDEYYKVLVTHVINPNIFYARIGSAASFARFNSFEDHIQHYCESCVDRATVYNLQPRHIVLAKNQDGKWLRGLVNSTDEDEVDVLAIDYYTTDFIPITNIIDIVPPAISSQPPQAFKCSLAGVQPIAQTWISRSTTYFTDLVLNEICDCLIVEYDGQDGLVLMDIFVRKSETSVIKASNIMLNEGLAMKAEARTGLKNKPVNIPKFNVDLLNQIVERQASSQSEEPNFEQEIFCEGIVRSDSHEGYELSDYNSKPVPQSSQFGSIREQISQMQNQSVQSEGNSAPSSPARAVQKKFQCESPSRPKNKSKETNISDKLTHTTTGSEHKSRSDHGIGSDQRNGSEHRTGSGHRIRSDHRTGSGHKTGPDHRTRSDKKAGTDQKPRPGHRSPASSACWPRKESSKERQQKRTPPRVESESSASTQNYDREKVIFQSNVFEVLKRCQVAEAHEHNNVIDDLHKLVFPSESRLKDLLGSKELPLMLDVLLEQASDDISLQLPIIHICQTFINSPNFPTVLSEKLWHYHNINIKESRHRTNFCQFLAQLFIKSQLWIKCQESVSINVCIINMVERWRDNMTMVVPDTVELYLNCLLAFFGTAGQVFEQHMPMECASVIDTAKDLLFTSRLPRKLKERLYKLLQLNIIWDVSVAAPVTPDKPQSLSQTTQTNPVHKTDFEVQVEIELPLHEIQQSKPEIEPLNADDEFWKVKVMLRELNLENLVEVFIENAVVDDLLDVDFNELKHLLKECGLKPGHITRFKIYLNNKERRQKAEAKVLEHVLDSQATEPGVNTNHRMDQRAPLSQPQSVSSQQVAAQNDTHQVPLLDGVYNISRPKGMPSLLDLKTPSEFLNSSNGQGDCSYEHKSEFECTTEQVDNPQDPSGKCHPCSKYNLKSMTTVVTSWLSNDDKYSTYRSEGSHTPENLPTREKPHQEPAWKVENTEGNAVMTPPLNLALSEFPPISKVPVKQKERSVSQSPPTPRSYLPPPPDQSDKPHLKDFSMGSLSRKNLVFPEAVDISQTDYGVKKVKINEIGKTSTFGQNLRCTKCKSMSHNVNGCPERSRNIIL